MPIPFFCALSQALVATDADGLLHSAVGTAAVGGGDEEEVKGSCRCGEGHVAAAVSETGRLAKCDVEDARTDAHDDDYDC
jgi:hypothetical protein